MLKEKIYFIAAIGTDLGKTFLVENLCKKLNASAIKPIVSGCRDDDENSDPAKILAACGQNISIKNLDSISPWRFEKAVSPHFAGKINFDEVKNFCAEKISAAKKTGQFLFVEGAGGVMTPLNDEKTFLDLNADLNIPTLLLTANYLGSISHTLCAIEAMKNLNISLEKIIINDHSPSGEKPSLADDAQLISTLKNFSSAEILTLKNLIK